MWFDAYEFSVDQMQALPFPWLQLLKGIIFDLFKNEENMFELNIFEKTLKSKLWDPAESITFADVLFGKRAF